jgi:hypothetical protein
MSDGCNSSADATFPFQSIKINLGIAYSKSFNEFRIPIFVSKKLNTPDYFFFAMLG